MRPAIMVRLITAAWLAAVAGLSGAHGDPLPLPELPAAEPNVPADERTLAGAVAQDPSCRERTNGCEICVAAEAGRLSCSLPGIACQPGGWRCIGDSGDKPSPPGVGR
jgi:hypothetical protein